MVPMRVMLRGGGTLDGKFVTADVHDNVVRILFTQMIPPNQLAKLGLSGENVGPVTVIYRYEHRGQRFSDKDQTPIFEFVEIEG